MRTERQVDQSIPEIWFEAADTRRLAVLFRRIAVSLVATVAVGATVMTVVLSDRIAVSERFEDQRLAAALAAADPSVRDDLAAAAGREAMIVEIPPDEERPVEYPFTVLVAREVPDQSTLDWLRVVALRAVGDDAEWFESQNDEQDWWHSVARVSDRQVLVIHRPRSQALATANALRLWVVGLGALLIVGLIGVWLVLRSRIQRPTNTLMEAVEDLRVRGEIRSSTRADLERLPESPVELKRLARAVTDIEGEIRGAFNEIDSLLRGAEALGSSLDPSDVLSTSLEHLEHLLGAERSAIVALDHRRATTEVLAIHGHDRLFLEALTDQPYDPTLPSVRASRELQPVQISDTESDFVGARLRGRAKRFGYRSLLAVPLPPVLRTPTVLILHKSEPYTYSHYEIELSVSFASIAAAALRNAELFAQTDQSLSEQTSRLSAIVDSVDDGLLVEGRDGALIYANGALTGLACDRQDAATLLADRSPSSRLLDLVLDQAVAPGEAKAAVDRVRASGDAWCEVELATETAGPQTWRVRSFVVTDPLEVEIGRGLIWTDVTRDRELDRMKSGLLATVSHEFRTPLALIKGYATTLLAEDVQWAEADRFEFLELVAKEADRLTNLVQRLLDMRRIDAGLVDLQTVSIELDSLVAGAVAGVGPAADRIAVQPIPELLVLADEARIVTALRNLLDNACKYSPADQEVAVEAERSGDEAVIRIADRGAGVPEQDRNHLFDMFVRGDHGLDAMHGGTGLGLAIARGFVVAHGGRIWIEDRPGGGSVFAMSLPVVIEPAPADEPRAAVPAP